MNTIEKQIENYRWNVWALRTNKGWSQEMLAEAAGISRVTISRIESGKREEGGLHTMLLIAAALGVSAGEMLETRAKPALLKPYLRKRR